MTTRRELQTDSLRLQNAYDSLRLKYNDLLKKAKDNSGFLSLIVRANGGELKIDYATVNKQLPVDQLSIENDPVTQTLTFRIK